MARIIRFDTYAESELEWLQAREMDPDYPEREPGSPALVCFEDEEMVGADDLVVPSDTIMLVLDYPLSQSTERQATSPGGFTRKGMALAILAAYREVYAEEAADAGDPGLVPGLFNRARSNGRHGIWGHDIENLFLEGAELGANGTYTVIMGS
jgi:hypothetical protein